MHLRVCVVLVYGDDVGSADFPGDAVAVVTEGQDADGCLRLMPSPG